MSPRASRRAPTDRGDQSPGQSPSARTWSRLWSVDDVAAFLGVPVGTLYSWRHRGIGPPAYRVGRHLRYRPEKVIAWVESCEEAPEMSGSRGSVRA